MSEIVLESKSNYHSVQEIETFGDFLLSKIRDIRDSKVPEYVNVINTAFDCPEYEYPEKYFYGVHKRIMNGNPYYTFARLVKGKTKRFGTKHAFSMYKYVLFFGKKYKRNIYKDKRINNFLK